MTNQLLVALLVVASTWCLSLVANGQPIIYVSPTATGANDGSSWQDAYLLLQDALDTAKSGDQIWVGQGIYTPDRGGNRAPGDRSETFQLKSGVQIYGGFSGSESLKSERRIEVFRTILSGDLLNDDRPGFGHRGDNSYHVVMGSTVDGTALLDGFYVRGGNANGPESDSLGGGLLIIDGSPSVMNSVFLSNKASRGGGVYSAGQTPEIVNSVFSGNSATAGGALYNSESDARIVNTTIVNNYADVGAGIYNENSSPVIANSVIARNGPTILFQECQRAGYPCTLGEVEPSVIARSIELGTQVRALFDAGQPTYQVRDWLASQSDVVSIKTDTLVIRFRIEGGRATWVLGDEAKGIFQSASNKLSRRTGDVSPQRAQVTSRDVVGRDTNSDGKRNNRDDKRALVLSPYQFEDDFDEGEEVAALLEATRGYAGNVVFKKDAEVGTEAFSDWDKYDVVHLSTHGGRACDEESCEVGLVTGTKYQGSSDDDLEIGLDLYVDDAGSWIGVNADFFAEQYPDGLDRTILFISSCESGDGDEDPVKGTPPDVAVSLFGGTRLAQGNVSSIFLGWTETVWNFDARDTALEFYDHTTVSVLPAVAAKDKIRADGGGISQVDSGRVAEFRAWKYKDSDLYVREIVTIVDADGNALEDGANVEFIFDGVTNDGENDDLLVDLLVEGVDQDLESVYTLQLEMDGVSLGPPIPLTTVDIIKEVEEYRFSITDIISAGRDIKPNQKFALEAIIGMPDGGESRYEARGLEVGACFWNLTLGGTHAGSYSGDRAQFIENTNPVGFTLGLSSSDPSNPISLIQIFLAQPPPPGASGPYSIDGSDGSATLSLDVTGPPFIYFSGDGEVLTDVDGNPVFTTPDDAKLSISTRTDAAMIGILSGTFVGQTNIDVFYPQFEGAPVAVEFRAESGQNALSCGGV